MSVLVFDGVMVEGEILCSMISLTCLTDAIEIAKHKGCNVIIKQFHAWKMMRTVFHEDHIYSPGCTMYVIE
jgi:hypothetical protein